MAKIYLASSWKNEAIVKRIAEQLRGLEHEVDAFCDQSNGRFVFSFDQLPNVEKMDAKVVLNEEIVQKAFHEDKKWLDWADGCLLILPSGKSAHLEAGYAKGQGKFLIIYQDGFPTGDFDVMYGFADLVTDNMDEIIEFLANQKKMFCLNEDSVAEYVVASNRAQAISFYEGLVGKETMDEIKLSFENDGVLADKFEESFAREMSSEDEFTLMLGGGEEFTAPISEHLKRVVTVPSHYACENY